MAKNKTSNGLSERTSDIILVVITAVVLFIVAYPLYYVLMASFSNPYDVYAGKTFLLPSGFTLEGFKDKSADNLLAAIEAQRGVKLDRGQFSIGESLREVGEYEAKIDLGQGVAAKCKITILDEAAPAV